LARKVGVPARNEPKEPMYAGANDNSGSEDIFQSLMTESANKPKITNSGGFDLERSVDLPTRKTSKRVDDFTVESLGGFGFGTERYSSQVEAICVGNHYIDDSSIYWRPLISNSMVYRQM
jgi:hypothetical protein